MKVLVFLLTAMFLLSSSCNKENGLVIFDITVVNKDNSVVTEGFIKIFGSKDGFTGFVTIFNEDFPIQNGKTLIEVPYNTDIETYQITYRENSNNRPSQKIVGCNHEFDQSTCVMSKGQRKFVIDITLQ